MDSASCQDMDAVADRCGRIGVNDRYLLLKYGVPYKEWRCGRCDRFTHTQYSYGICSMVNERRWEGAHGCNNFLKSGHVTLLGWKGCFIFLWRAEGT